MSDMLIVKSAYCPSFDEWAKRNDCRHTWNETPQIGDVALFDFSGNHTSRDHVGIVVGVSGSTITTIEGNTGTGNNANGGMVMERQRSTAYVVSFIRPKYTARQTAARLVEIARSQVGVKESPANSNNVKYNTWYYGKVVAGSSYAWCGAFVSWCFAVLAGEISDDSTVPGMKTPCIVTASLEMVDGIHEAGKGTILSLQAILRAKGFKGADGEELELDGEWGPNTSYALAQAQKAAGLTADRECGGLSWAGIVKLEV